MKHYINIELIEIEDLGPTKDGHLYGGTYQHPKLGFLQSRTTVAKAQRTNPNLFDKLRAIFHRGFTKLVSSSVV